MKTPTELERRATGRLEEMVRKLADRLDNCQTSLNSMEAQHVFHGKPPYHDPLSVAYHKDTRALLEQAEDLLANKVVSSPKTASGRGYASTH